MTDYLLTAYRKAPMRNSQEKRFDDLIERYGRGHGYNCCCDEDGNNKSDFDVELLVDGEEITRAASEFRGCGFVVLTEKLPEL